jgi:hypothetical protein
VGVYVNSHDREIVYGRESIDSLSLM